MHILVVKIVDPELNKATAENFIIRAEGRDSFTILGRLCGVATGI